LPERHAYHHYRILEHVEQTPRLTNRKLATKLGVSVKLAHELLTGLVKRGLLHVRKRHARRWDYFLTPKGITEKGRLTLQFVEFSMQFYREARRRSSAVLAAAARSGVKRVAFLGATELAEIALLGVQESKVELVDIFDPDRAGEDFLGYEVRPLSEMAATRAQKILITAFDPTEPMSRRYLPQGADDDNRFLWIFDVPKTEADVTSEDQES